MPGRYGGGMEPPLEGVAEKTGRAVSKDSLKSSFEDFLTAFHSSEAASSLTQGQAPLLVKY